MRKIFLLVLAICFSTYVFAEAEKKEKTLEEQIRNIKIPKREEILQKVDPRLKKNAEDAEIKALRKGKVVEAEIVEMNENKQIVKDYKKIKDKVTTKKKIQGEEFVVLKDAETLRNMFDKERKRVEEIVKKEAKKKHEEKLQNEKSSITTGSDLTAEAAASQLVVNERTSGANQEVSVNTIVNKPVFAWVFVVFVVSLIVAGLAFFKFKRKKK